MLEFFSLSLFLLYLFLFPLYLIYFLYIYIFLFPLILCPLFFLFFCGLLGVGFPFLIFQCVTKQFKYCVSISNIMIRRKKSHTYIYTTPWKVLLVSFFFLEFLFSFYWCCCCCIFAANESDHNAAIFNRYSSRNDSIECSLSVAGGNMCFYM